MICAHQASPRSASQRAQHVTGPALDDVEESVAVEVDDLGREHRAVLGGRVEEPLLVDPDRGDALEPGRVVDDRVGVSATAVFAVCHPTPNSAAAAAIESPSTLTISAIRARARSVSDARGAISSTVSDHVRDLAHRLGATPPALGQHQHRRPPAIGRSRTVVRLRP